MQWSYSWIDVPIQTIRTTVLIPDSWSVKVPSLSFLSVPATSEVARTNNTITLYHTQPVDPQVNYDVAYSVPTQNSNCGYGSLVNVGLVVGVVVGGVAVIVIILGFFIILHLVVTYNKKRKQILLPLTATTVVATPVASTPVQSSASPIPVLSPQQPNIENQHSQANLLSINTI